MRELPAIKLFDAIGTGLLPDLDERTYIEIFIPEEQRMDMIRHHDEARAVRAVNVEAFLQNLDDDVASSV